MTYKKNIYRVVIILTIVLVVMIIMNKCENSRDENKKTVSFNKKTTYVKPIEWPRDYRETLKNPDKNISVYPKKDAWLQAPINVSGMNWFWFDLVDKNASDDRAYVRCASKPEGLMSAEVEIVNLNGNKRPFGIITSCRYFDIKLPPDTKLENPQISFRIKKMR